MNKEYYDKILSLYEATIEKQTDEEFREDSVAGKEEKSQQSQVSVSKQDDGMGEFEEYENLEDESEYLDGKFSEVPSYEEPIEPGRKRIEKVNLYDLLVDLRTEAEILRDSILSLRNDNIDEGKMNRIIEYNRIVDGIIKKVGDYINYSFLEDDNETVMYIYTLLRTEFVKATDLIRRTLRIKGYNTKNK